MQQKLCLVVAAGALLLLQPACSGKKSGPRPVAAKGVTLSSLASGLKTAAGKTVDAYEVGFPDNKTSVILVVGGGKLEKSSPCPLALNGEGLMLDFTNLKTQVAVVSKQRPAVFIAGVTPAEAKAKCVPGRALDLPVDKALEGAAGTGTWSKRP